MTQHMSVLEDSSHQNFATICGRKTCLPAMPFDPFDLIWSREMATYI